jgi:hypothetical protein
MTTTTATLPNGITISVENILRVYRAASTDDVVSGVGWYRDARNVAQDFATANGLNVTQAIGVVAALSPRTPWGTNVMLAERCIRERGIHFGTLGENMRAANRIVNGENPLDVLNGPKVRAFYATILDPSENEAVVIDTHAMSVAAGRTLTATERKIISRVGIYEIFASLYREAAEILGVLPNHVQSVTWLAWRSMSKRERAGQTSLS